MNAPTDESVPPPAGSTDRRPRRASPNDARDSGQAERFRATARRIATRLDHAEVAAGIEAAMWRTLGKEPEG